jgi:tetratricopeptide (TPR) repeat protein/sugar lactone lactonase YvrE
MKRILALLVLALVLVPTFSVLASASEPYSTYTYTIDGELAESPAAYVPVVTVDSKYMGLETPLSSDIRDLFVAPDGQIYIADAANNRIVILDRYYKYRATISNFINEHGVPDSFTNPSGVFVNEENIYVCDTDANRIVVFDLDGNYERIIEKPSSKLFGEDAIYKPVAMVVDRYNRLYVVSSTTYQGVIVMTEEGQFVSFLGAQKVAYNIFQIFLRRFQTDEQRATTTQYVSTEYNNIAVDSEGFVYVTTSSVDLSKQLSAIRDKNGDYAPVKMLNAEGDEIMKRNGFFSPAGEVQINTVSTSKYPNPSKVIDVAVGPSGTWSIIDESRSKIYTYDENGNLLFAFGDTGIQKGNIQSIEAIAYQGNDMVILDKQAQSFTVYKRTEYGDILIQALENEQKRNYDEAINFWQEVIKRNSNFDTAYIGIGKALYRSADYEESLKYFEAAYDTSNWSNSYKEMRKEWISSYILLIPVVLIVFLFVYGKFNKFAKKVNKETALKVGKKTYLEELLYVKHLAFHPFDGFWDLKHEQRGSVRAGTTILALTIIAFFYQAIGTGYVLNPRGEYSSIWMQAISVLVPVILWIVSNWCLTTLFDGEGSLKDIYIAVTYSLYPLPIFLVVTTLASNVVTESEAQLVTFFVSIAFIWVGILIFFGMQVTHDYSMSKNILTCLGTIVGMALIMFVAILFSGLFAKMVSFVSNIIVELQYRA